MHNEAEVIHRDGVKTDLASACQVQEGTNALPKLLHQLLLTYTPQVSCSLDFHPGQLIANLEAHSCSIPRYCCACISVTRSLQIGQPGKG